VTENLGTQFLGSAQTNFNHFPKIFNHSMDHGLLSTIDIIIENFKFFPKNIWVIIFKKLVAMKLFLVIIKVWQPKVVLIATYHMV